MSSDAELHELFVNELTERSAYLQQGARSMREGSDVAYVASDMAREGHTIKGTGRVMGYDDVASAGLMCEDIWRWIQRGELDPFPALGEALLRLAEILPDSQGDAAPIAVGMHGVLQALDGIDLPGELPEPTRDGEEASVNPVRQKVQFDVAEPGAETRQDDPPPEPAPAPAAPPVAPGGPVDLAALLATGAQDGPIVFDATEESQLVSSPENIPVPVPVDASQTGNESVDEPVSGPAPVPSDVQESVLPVAIPAEQPTAQVPNESMTYDLGGLVGALQTWASEESVLVNAGGLFRLINDIAAIRIDLAAATEKSSDLAGSAAHVDPRLADQLEASAEAMNAMLRAAMELENGALRLASVPLKGITDTLPQLVRYLSKKTGTEVSLDLSGEDLLVDRQVLDHLGDAVRQLVVNAIAHGIERADVREAAGKSSVGQLRVAATAKGTQLEVIISDDGAGVDWDRVRRVAFDRDLVLDPEQAAEDVLRGFLYLDGFTTETVAGEISGDGAGLARVKEVAEELYGTFTFDTKPGVGTTVKLTVPMFRALQRALLVECSGQIWGIPEAAVADVLPIDAASISVTQDGTKLDWHGDFVPFGVFGEVIGLDHSEPGEHVVVLSTPLGAAALAVTDVVGTREVAAKELGALLSGTQTVTGAALLGGEDVVLLVDAGRLAERLRDAAGQTHGPVHRVLVVDDSKGVQQVVAGALASSGFSTVTAGSVSEALSQLGEYEVDALVVDFSMPRADGVALVHMVRQRFGSMPIIMLSGVANQEDVERAKKAGVDAFFDKGDFRKGALAETLRSLIGAEDV